MKTLAPMEITVDGGAGGDGGSGEGRPEWLPDNFKSPEDLAKSYDETRREMDRLRSQLDQERNQFSEALTRIEAQTAVQPQPAGGSTDLLAAYQQAVAEGDAAAQLAITLQLNQQIVTDALDARFKDIGPKLDQGSKADQELAFRMAEERVEREFGDAWEGLAPGVDKLLKERPHWIPKEATVDGYLGVLREAASLVRAEKVLADQQSAERDRAAKLSAQTAGSSGVSRFPIVTDEKKQAWQEIKDAPTGSFSEISKGS